MEGEHNYPIDADGNRLSARVTFKSKEKPTDTPTETEKLAYVEAFLLGLARRLDNHGYSNPDLLLAAEDCRAVAASVARIGVPMGRPQQKTA